MSGLRDRIFPRSGDAPSEPREGEPATSQPSGSRPDDDAGQTASLPTAAPSASRSPAGGAYPGEPVTGETAALPVADRSDDWPPDQNAGSGADESAATGPAGGVSPEAGQSGGGGATGGSAGSGAGAIVQSPAAVAGPDSPGFAERSRLRRRLRYLRKLRELLLRDLGGFVFDARRFQRPRDDIVQAKLSRLAGVDTELRALEAALKDRRPVQELREPGIGGVCDVCGSYFASTAKFCSECGSPAIARRDAAAMASPAPAAPAPAALAQPGAPLPPAAPSPAPAPDPAAPPPRTGTTLWSTGAPEHQATPPSGVEPVSAQEAEPGAAADAPPPPEGHPPAPAAVAPPPEAGERPAAAAPPGGLARPDDESAAAPPMSSGDPLQQR